MGRRGGGRDRGWQQTAQCRRYINSRRGQYRRAVRLYRPADHTAVHRGQAEQDHRQSAGEGTLPRFSSGRGSRTQQR